MAKLIGSSILLSPVHYTAVCRRGSLDRSCARGRSPAGSGSGRAQRQDLYRWRAPLDQPSAGVRSCDQYLEDCGLASDRGRSSGSDFTGWETLRHGWKHGERFYQRPVRIRPGHGSVDPAPLDADGEKCARFCGNLGKNLCSRRRRHRCDRTGTRSLRSRYRHVDAASADADGP